MPVEHPESSMDELFTGEVPAELRTFDAKGDPLTRQRWDKGGNQIEDKTFGR
jgi:hypothetical protein